MSHLQTYPRPHSPGGTRVPIRIEDSQYIYGDHPSEYRDEYRSKSAQRSHSPFSESQSLDSGRRSRGGGATVEILAAENPACPPVKGLCCLILLLNLALLVICLGFVLIIHFVEPGFAMVLGLIIVLFGFLALTGSLIYCYFVFKRHRDQVPLGSEPEPYWNYRWARSISVGDKPTSNNNYNP